MDHFPAFINIKKRTCLVVGGGKIATRKANLLLRSGGNVTIVAPEISSELTHLVNDNQITWIERGYHSDDIHNNCIVIAATNDKTINHQIAAQAQEKNILVNNVDDPNAGNFIVPSIIDRSPVIAAVSTGGASPVLARLIRARLESLIPAGYGRLATLARQFRERVKQTFVDPADRRIFWDKVFQGGVAERVFSGHMDEATITLEKELEAAKQQINTGEVYLVGAGPGDPDLLTFRALRLMQQAEVVVYDRLVAQPILEMTRQDAKRIYVGKERNNHAMRQEDINQLLADLAKEGKRVVRLKGGDPFIFGRGGEEIDTLAEQGIPFQVVPGITAAAGCASYSGIPLTHRDYAQSVTFVTGHLKDGSMNLNWPQLAQPKQTIVFYMGLVGLPVIREQLIAHGVSEDMPIALIQQGTTHKHKVFSGTLANILDIVEKEQPKPPTLIIVGEVVELQEKLSWYKAPSESTQGATSTVGNTQNSSDFQT